MFSLTFTRRDFSGPFDLPGLAWAVERMDWRAVGGPYRALLRADAADPARLAQLLDCLRCGLTITDARAAAWWGYLAAVELRAGASTLRLALDELTNKLAVAYRDFAPSEWGGARLLTPWLSDADSIRVYGEKQRLYALDETGQVTSPQCGPEEAAARAAALLARVARPNLTAHPASIETANPRPYVLIEARGWWDTLDWRYYSQPLGLHGWRGGGSGLVFGAPTGWAKLGQYVVPTGADTWKAAEVYLRLARKGPVTDTLKLELAANNAGVPGTVLASVTVSGASLSEDQGWVRFALPVPLQLTAGTGVFLLLSRTGALDAAAYYLAAQDTSGAYPNGYCVVWNGSAWAWLSTPNSDLNFHITGVEETDKQFARMLAPTTGGQFLSGLRVESPTGVSARLYRDGSTRCGAEVEALLQAGTSSGTRLLARVEPDRTARIYPQPAAPVLPAGAMLQIDPSGRITRADGRALACSDAPAGQWALLAGLTPAYAPANAAVFLESVGYRPGQGLRCQSEA